MYERTIVSSFNGLGWTVTYEDFDLGDPVGSSARSEAEAREDFLEQVGWREEGFAPKED